MQKIHPINTQPESNSQENLESSPKTDFDSSTTLDDNKPESLDHNQSNSIKIISKSIQVPLLEANEKGVEKLPAHLEALQDVKELRLYQIWPGKNRFYFNGKVMAGPREDIESNITAWVLIILIGTLYFVFAFPYMWNNITIILPIASLILYPATIIFLIVTSFTDPGIIPRKAIFEINGPVPDAFNGNAIKDKNKDLENPGLQSQLTNYKYCQTCDIYRPDRCSHCNACGNCVEVFDHHCPFVNNCIGKRNYRYFIGFIVSLQLMLLIVFLGFAFMVLEAIGNIGTFNLDSLKGSIVVVVFIVLIGVAACCFVLAIAGLCCFHLFLIITGKTTREQLKNISAKEANKNTNNWGKSDPVLFDRRQILSTEQIANYWNNITKEKTS